MDGGNLHVRSSQLKYVRYVILRGMFISCFAHFNSKF